MMYYFSVHKVSSGDAVYCKGPYGFHVNLFCMLTIRKISRWIILRFSQETSKFI